MDRSEKARGIRAGTPRRMTEPQDLQGMVEPSSCGNVHKKNVMNLKEPSAKIDLAVAKAAGLDRPFISEGLNEPDICMYGGSSGPVTAFDRASGTRPIKCKPIIHRLITFPFRPPSVRPWSWRVRGQGRRPKNYRLVAG